VLDPTKIHETLRDLVRVFEGLAEKKRVIDYLDRFIGDLVGRSGGIPRPPAAFSPRARRLSHLGAGQASRYREPAQDTGPLTEYSRFAFGNLGTKAGP
jgi:hypothetical protein